MAAGALWLLPFGLLVLRSGFIPAVLGVLLILASFTYLAVGVASLLFPEHASTIARFLALGIGEVLIILWLVIKGVRTEPAQEGR